MVPATRSVVSMMSKLQFQAVAAVYLFILVSASKQDPSTGHIIPTSGLAPDFNPEVWNQAYKLTVRNVPFKGSERWLQSNNWNVDGLYSILVPENCTSEGFDSTPASNVPLGACFFQKTSSTTYDFWVKVPGLARRNGNCYCYALDYFKGDYCHPSERNDMTCTALSASMKKDGAEPVSRQEALSGKPSKGHYIALMAKPKGCGRYSGGDYHFLRKDSDGTWSWKLPTRPSTNKDLFGKTITDPEANPVPGPYQVCGYYRVELDKMNVTDNDRELGPLADMSVIKKYKDTPGVTVAIFPVPYNAAADAVVPKREAQLDERDKQWEEKKGTKEYAEWQQKRLRQLGLIPGVAPKDPCE